MIPAHIKMVFSIFFACACLGGGQLLSSEEKTPRELLTRAIEDNNLSGVRSLIESSKVNLEEPTKDYGAATPLTEAACEGRVEIMKYLIEQGAEVDVVAKDGSTPLSGFLQDAYKVPIQSLLDMTRLLIASGANVNTPGENGATPLMLACAYIPALPLVEELLDLGANIDAYDDYEHSALVYSIENYNNRAFRILIEKGANRHIGSFSMLGIAALSGNIDIAKVLIDEFGYDVNKYDQTGAPPIFWASALGENAMIHFLVENGADINAKIYYSLTLQRPRVFLQIGTYYFIFPINSTPLTFAKAYKKSTTINVILDLGGTEPSNIQVREKFSIR